MSTLANDSSNENKCWMLASCGASLAFTFSVAVRGVMVDNVLTAQGLLSIVAFLHGFLFVIITKLYRHCTGNTTPLGWVQPDRDAEGKPIPGTDRFRKSTFGVLLVRGALEFVGSTLLLVTLKIAKDHDINQGISTATIVLAGPMFSLLSWCFYGERLTCPLFLGLGTILTALAIIGVSHELSETLGEDGH